jgi:hypothetical protein
MNKDIIYIDVEDDITAIIGKIKASNEKIIALVPPKRVGLLQSAVNLRLLQRMASNSHKNLVLITNNQALVALAAAAKIPVAKNLQSKPEIAEISAIKIDDDDDIIDGSHIAIGELQKTADLVSVTDKSVDDIVEDIDIDDEPVAATRMGAVAVKQELKSKSNGIKVPNFNSFRKKLFIGISIGVLVVAFLVWATVFAPSAKVIVTARTTPASVNTTVTLAGNAATDTTKGLIQSKVQTLKRDVSVDFDATGSKNIGTKATGSVNYSNSNLSSTSVPAGTQLQSSGGSVFITDTAVTVPAASFPCGNISCPSPGSASGTVTAAEGGANYNGGSGNLSGEPSGISATFTSPTAGGTDKVATVVSADDFAKATDKLNAQATDQAKKDVIKLFTNGEVVIDDSFTVDRAAPVSAPAVDTEATTGKAKLTSSTTYTITAIAKPDLEVYLTADLTKQIVGKDNQKIYSDGVDKVSLSGYTKTATAATVKIITSGQIGPKIDETQVKEQIKGKKFGEVQTILGGVNGVDNVDVQFSFFWVDTIPTDTSKITIEFKIQ